MNCQLFGCTPADKTTWSISVCSQLAPVITKPRVTLRIDVTFVLNHPPTNCHNFQKELTHAVIEDKFSHKSKRTVATRRMNAVMLFWARVAPEFLDVLCSLYGLRRWNHFFFWISRLWWKLFRLSVIWGTSAMCNDVVSMFVPSLGIYGNKGCSWGRNECIDVAITSRRFYIHDQAERVFSFALSSLFSLYWPPRFQKAKIDYIVDTLFNKIKLNVSIFLN